MGDIHELTPAELEATSVEELPDRDALSLINADALAPVNLGIASVASDDPEVAEG